MRGMARVSGAFGVVLGRLAETWAGSCDSAQTEAITRYASLLLTWTARINLTGASSLDDLAAEHLPDSFALAARLGGQGADDPSLDVVDVGSGGGLPALPLAILRPALRIRLVESVAKKAAFLRTAVRELGLRDRISVDVKRAEALLPDAAFDVAISRATLPPEEWVKLGAGLVRPGGRVFVLSSSDQELAATGLTTSGRWPYLSDRRWLHELTRGN
jgi:16S rRNA (guanine527-N7)-methyltransferase